MVLKELIKRTGCSESGLELVVQHGPDDAVNQAN
jgi:hypothetical protein